MNPLSRLWNSLPPETQLGVKGGVMATIMLTVSIALTWGSIASGIYLTTELRTLSAGLILSTTVMMELALYLSAPLFLLGVVLIITDNSDHHFDLQSIAHSLIVLLSIPFSVIALIGLAGIISIVTALSLDSALKLTLSTSTVATGGIFIGTVVLLLFIMVVVGPIIAVGFVVGKLFSNYG